MLGLGVALPGWERLGLTGDREYFNAGVLVLDLIKCRELRIFERCQSFLVERSQHVKFCDQDALNWVVGDDWLRLERRWNTLPMSAILICPGERYNAEDIPPLTSLLADEGEVRILYFAGKWKPWTNSFPGCPSRRRYADLHSWVHGCQVRGQLGEPG